MYVLHYVLYYNDANFQVLAVKPGFVALKMTRGIDLPEELTDQPEEVAEDIYQDQRKEKIYFMQNGFEDG